MIVDQPPHEEIDDDRSDHHGHEDRLAPRVEQQAQGEQHEIAAAGEVIGGKANRQKKEEEDGATEKHLAPAPSQSDLPCCPANARRSGLADDLVAESDMDRAAQ